MKQIYAIYARQSIDKKDSISIDSQIEFCKRDIPPDTEFKVYLDKGYSGKNTERPQFQHLLKDIQSGCIIAVVVYRLDRMSRSLLDFAGLIEIFNKYNTDFVSCTEKFDTSSPIGRAMLSIIMVFAQLERETIQQRIRDNYYERGKKGMFLGGNIPFGLKLEPLLIDGIKTHKLVPNEYMVNLIDMYNKYAYTDMSLGKIARQLNDQSIPTCFDNGWDSHKISRTLKNPVYVKADAEIYTYFDSLNCIIHNDLAEFTGKNGLFVFGNKMPTGMKFSNLEGYTVAIGPHTGIIDSKTWLKCQSKLKKNVKIKNNGNSKNSWLSGLLKCKKCNYAMTVNKSNLSTKNKTYAIYFRCSGRTLKKTCDANSVYAKDVEMSVTNEIINFINNLNPEIVSNELTESNTANDLKLTIVSKEKEVENLIDNLAEAKGASMKFINKRLNKLDEEITELREELNNQIVGIDVGLSRDQIIQLKDIVSKWDGLDFDDKKEIANLLILKIYVLGDEASVIWRY